MFFKLMGNSYILVIMCKYKKGWQIVPIETERISRLHSAAYCLCNYFIYKMFQLVPM